EIVDVIEHAVLHTASIGNESAGVDAALPGARVDHDGLPLLRNAMCRELRFLQPSFGELEIRTAAKSFGLDSRNVPVAHEHDAHPGAGVRTQPECSAADFSTSPSTRKSAKLTSCGVQTAA